MENIAPPLILLWEVRRALEKGQSVGSGIKNYLQRIKTGNFRHQIERWWSSQFNPHNFYDKAELGLKRRFLVEILEAGLKGHGIMPALQNLEDELILSCEDEIQNHVALLPLYSLIPLMLFVFPSLMIVLVTPLMKMLLI